MAVEEALVGARGGGEGDYGALPGVRDDSLHAVLWERRGRKEVRGRGGERR